MNATQKIYYPYSQERLITFLKAINCNPHPVPLAPEKLERLRFAKYRDFNGETVPLPHVLQQILLIDQDFALGYDSNRFLYPLFDCLDHDTGIFHSVDLGLIINDWAQSQRKTKLVYKWNNFDKAPSVLPLGHVGEEMLFMYVCHRPVDLISDIPNKQPDPIEYPIARLTTPDFGFWVSELDLAHYMGQIARWDMHDFDWHYQDCVRRYKPLLRHEFHMMLE